LADAAEPLLRATKPTENLPGEDLVSKLGRERIAQFGRTHCGGHDIGLGEGEPDKRHRKPAEKLLHGLGIFASFQVHTQTANVTCTVCRASKHQQHMPSDAIVPCVRPTCDLAASLIVRR
jgi:hypothetical protein